MKPYIGVNEGVHLKLNIYNTSTILAFIVSNLNTTPAELIMESPLLTNVSMCFILIGR